MSGARQRSTWSDYALRLAWVASTQSQDPWVQVGATVLRPNHTVAGLGFNGPPSGVDIDWTDREGRRPLVVHAEPNALRHCQPADVAGGILASTHRPCAPCLATIASYGIRRVFYAVENDPNNYDAKELERVSQAFGLHVVRISA